MIRRSIVSAAFVAALAALLQALVPVPAAAHSQSYGFLTVRVGEGGALEGRLDLALRDIALIEPIDGDGDGRVTWGELRAREAELGRSLLGQIAIGPEDEPCRLTPAPIAVDQRGGEPYATLAFTGTCPTLGARLRVGYDLLFAADAQHRGIVDASRDGHGGTAVLTPEAREARIDVAETELVPLLAAFVGHGIHHILIGTDHILFVVSLLLASVVVRRDGRWEPVEDLPAAALATAKVVTAFTLAHSVTLSLAAFQILSLPSRLVESTIAASIVVAALNNVRPVVTRRLWIAAFAFGLVHGFGFASVLGDLGLPTERTLLALFAFNLGVEIGQLAVVAAVLPVLYLWRRQPAYAHLALPIGSLAIGVVALVWLIERASGVAILSA
jgi:hypothetical protein